MVIDGLSSPLDRLTCRQRRDGNTYMKEGLAMSVRSCKLWYFQRLLAFAPPSILQSHQRWDGFMYSTYLVDTFIGTLNTSRGMSAVARWSRRCQGAFEHPRA